MAGGRQPTANVIARGRKHFTKAEIDARLDAEDGVLTPEISGDAKKFKTPSVKVPSWLAENLKREFRATARQLFAARIYSNLDADTLARYLLARVDWLNAEKMANHFIVSKDGENAQLWSGIQDRYFKQCRACANDLGMTITSRCRMVIPQGTAGATTGRPEEPEDEFTRKLRARQELSMAGER